MGVSCSSDEFCQSLEPASWPLCRGDSLPRFFIFLPRNPGSAPKASPKKRQAWAHQGEYLCGSSRWESGGGGPTWPGPT